MTETNLCDNNINELQELLVHLNECKLQHQMCKFRKHFPFGEDYTKKIIADKNNRVIKKVIQNMATAVFLPI